MLSQTESKSTIKNQGKGKEQYFPTSGIVRMFIVVRVPALLCQEIVIQGCCCELLRSISIVFSF